ncbi:hypothetical protein GCM10011506_17070 [Marivirga lumbricoides]|uniref:Lysoplasmalogenase n=1 Tax=Marivirga lumbricoides TaxID=1046115 RepID=A0ABQ1LYQ0_9BACT|nr:hypothetical protein GCM10011506_17070 [Marivirga lumbricoides]
MIAKKYFFFLAALGEIIALLFDIELLHQICKPLLVLTLLIYFWDRSEAQKGDKWVFHVTLALAFSWVADIMLLFTDKNFLFFFAGLAGFLVAHVFYILAYWKATFHGRIKFGFSFIPLIIIGYAVLMGFLIIPYTDGVIQIPVALYTTVISIMLIFAWYRKGQTTRASFQWVFGGAILFVISDSILAINRFSETIPFAGLLVMVTYISAQWLIVNGLLKYESTV